MDKAMAYIDKLAAKLGVAAEHVYGVLVNQAVANGVSKIGGGLMLIAVAVVVSVIISRTIKNSDLDYLDVEWAAVIVSIALLVVLPVVISYFLMASGIKAVLNPEYYAIKEILDTIGGK
ncbi:hypothetical protein [Bacillus sp. Bos-x628]|uniref:hypothetical protein n=1 Tax=Bacillus maqinnsis TaxID=3229854 RepID=UPI00339032A5